MLGKCMFHIYFSKLNLQKQSNEIHYLDHTAFKISQTQLESDFILLNTMNKFTLKCNLKQKTFECLVSREIVVFTEFIEYKKDLLIAIGNYDRTISIHSLKEKRIIQKFENLQFYPLNLYYFKNIDEERCFTTGDFEIRIWDFSNGFCVDLYSGHKERTYILNDLSDLKKGLFACIDYNYEIKIWNYLKKQVILNMKSCEEFIRLSLYSHRHDPSHLYTCGNELFARVWCIKTGKFTRKFKSNGEAIIQIIFITKSLIANIETGSCNCIKIWNFNLDICLKTINLGGICKKILFYKKLDIILTFINSKVLYFDIRNHLKIYCFEDEQMNIVTDCCLDYYKSKLISCGMDKVLISWNLNFN